MPCTVCVYFEWVYMWRKVRMSVESINTCIANNINGGFGKKKLSNVRMKRKRSWKKKIIGKEGSRRRSVCGIWLDDSPRLPQAWSAALYIYFPGLVAAPPVAPAHSQRHSGRPRETELSFDFSWAWREKKHCVFVRRCVGGVVRELRFGCGWFGWRRMLLL